MDSIIAQNVFREDDRPLYRRGLLQLWFITLATIPLLLLTKFYYVWRNKSKAKIWDQMSEDERAEYIRTTTDDGNKRLDFRFAH